jgi:hypothetical protein
MTLEHKLIEHDRPLAETPSRQHVIARPVTLPVSNE